MTHAFFTTSAEIPFGLTSDQTVQEHAHERFQVSTCDSALRLCWYSVILCQEREKHFLLSPFEEEQLSIRMSGGCLALLGTPPCVLIGNGSVQFLMTLWLSNQFNSVQLLLFSFFGVDFRLPGFFVRISRGFLRSETRAIFIRPHGSLDFGDCTLRVNYLSHRAALKRAEERELLLSPCPPLCDLPSADFAITAMTAMTGVSCGMGCSRNHVSVMGRTFKLSHKSR